MNASPRLPYTREDSARAHREWKASCGHHSIAAAAGVSLASVHAKMQEEWLKKRRGWMSPSMLEYLLKELGVRVQRTYGLRTRELRNGICRVQFEGPWIGVGKAVAEGYKYTHYVAVRDGWVLCTVANPHHWVPESTWRPAIARFAVQEPSTGWHVTHWYEFESLT